MKTIKDAMIIDGPLGLKEAPTAYYFDRPRSVNIEWVKLLETHGIQRNSYGMQMLTFVLEWWKKSESIFDDISDEEEDVPEFEDKKEDRLISKEDEKFLKSSIEKYSLDLNDSTVAYVHDPETVETLKVLSSKFRLFRKTKTTGAVKTSSRVPLSKFRDIPNATKTLPRKNGTIISLPSLGPIDETADISSSDRFKWLLPFTVDPTGKKKFFSKSDLKNPETWNSNIINFETVYYHNTPEGGLKEESLGMQAAKTSFPASEVIRADAAFILRQFNYLKNELNIATKRSQVALNVLEGITSESSLEEIQAISERYRSLVNYESVVNENLKALSDAALDLGYVLILSNSEKFVYYDETGTKITDNLIQGELYLKSRRTVNWKTVHYQSRGRTAYGRKKTPKKITTKHRRNFDYYEVVTVDFDPWNEAAEFYKSNGFEVFLFFDSDAGLISNDGNTPDDVLERCRFDEAFRRKCVVAVPLYELTIIGEKFLIGYDFIIRPEPEFVVSDYPDIFVKEQMSYRFAWKGVSLGEINSVIPMGPGEERTVTVKVSRSSKTSRTTSTTSLMEVSRVDKSDFETVFEKEVRKEKEKTKTTDVSVEGSYGGVVSGSGSMSSETKTKDISRTLNRSVKKASQEINRKSREETKISFSSTDEETSSVSTTYKLKNINIGSTLNIAFYNLYNKYQSQLSIENIKIQISSGRTINSGDSSRTLSTFSSSEHDLFTKFLYEDLEKYTNIKLKNDSDLEAFYREVLETIRNSHEALNDKSRLTLKSFAAVDFTAKSYSEFKDACDKWDEAFINKDQNSSDPNDFNTSSGGFYCDVHRGVNPATDKYSESMRMIELEKNRAEVSKLMAEARNLELNAANKLNFLDKEKIHATSFQVLLDDHGHPLVRFQIVPAFLPRAGWNLFFKDEGGEYPQSQLPGADGVISFELPRRFLGKDIEILKWTDAKVTEQVKLLNATMGVELNYRRLSEIEDFS